MVADSIAAARTRKRAIVWGLGGHVIKCGLAPVLIDLMHRGYATAFALNGAAAIHDFEIALAGHTSEDVEAVLPDGRFGSAEETGREMNRAIAEGVRDGLGMGEALGRRLETLADPACAPFSLLLQAYRAAVPVTVHVAIGTDTPHTHPAADGAAIGGRLAPRFSPALRLSSRTCTMAACISTWDPRWCCPKFSSRPFPRVRNLGHPLGGFTTANFDFLQHYRPRVNVVERPHAGSGGTGYAITGHHELMIPLLAAALIEKDS